MSSQWVWRASVQGLSPGPQSGASVLCLSPGPQSSAWHPYKKKPCDTQKRPGETEADIRVLCLQQGHPGALARPAVTEQEAPFPGVFSEHGPANTLILACWPPGPGEKGGSKFWSGLSPALSRQVRKGSGAWTVAAGPVAFAQKVTRQRSVLAQSSPRPRDSGSVDAKVCPARRTAWMTGVRFCRH